MTPEEKAIKLWLIDLPESQQRRYQNDMNYYLEMFTDWYHSYNNKEYQELFLASLGMAMIKFGQYVEEQENKP